MVVIIAFLLTFLTGVDGAVVGFVQFDPEQRFYAGILAGPIKLNMPVYIAVVGYGKGGNVKFLSLGNQLVNLCKAVKDAKGGMDMNRDVEQLASLLSKQIMQLFRKSRSRPGEGIYYISFCNDILQMSLYAYLEKEYN